MAILYDYLGRNCPISKPVDGWQPPDTDELKKLCDQLRYVEKRIHSLRVAVSMNYGKETAGRIHLIMASRKKAIEKAYQKGFHAGRKKHRHA